MALARREFMGGLLAVGTLACSAPASAATTFRPIPTQFLAALGNPLANSGTGAENWGLWKKDPGPRGVRLAHYADLASNGGLAPAQWTFDTADWWLEEHGLIMEQPEFGIAPGKYLVTGDRIVQTTLTVFPKDATGTQHWQLDDGAVLYDVTHLRCRSARYTPAESGKPCTPATVNPDNFPVDPGAAMPSVGGCNKQDYAVLFVVGVAE
jgi:hypothetical protein